jgi:hypothetical protein
MISTGSRSLERVGENEVGTGRAWWHARLALLSLGLAGLLAGCSGTGGDGSGGITPPPIGGEAGDLMVTPDDELSASGPQGGPFGPVSITYSVTNDGSDPINWTAASGAAWATVSNPGGVMEPGGGTTVDVSIDQSAAAGLGLGTHVAVITITDEDAGDSVTRDVSLMVSAQSGGGNTAAQLTQFGITWTFDRPYEVGQFANGDWWVVGPVTIIGISPKSTRANGRVMNGSMVNPSPKLNTKHGYDSTMYAQYKTSKDYQDELNVALDVSASRPLLVPTHSSLVSTISAPTPDTRPQVKGCSILTVLPVPAPAGSFRPAYCGSNKTISFNESQLQYSRLASLAPVGGMPSLASVEREFERPWLDHVPLWVGRYLHATNNMPDYGREIGDAVSRGGIYLNLDYTNAQKRTLLVRYVQLGIDLYGIAMDGGQNNWPPSAGHMNGRKWPILFAGLMLGHSGMSNIGLDKTIEFGEDGQTFYVAQTSPGVYNFGFGGYNASHVGLPEWGTAHSNKPSVDDSTWFGDPYRLCCTANSWWGQLLAARVMGAKALWNHDALFDYQDRYLTENQSRNITDWRLSWSGWQVELWKKHRPNY